jgi:hypothetical protein
MQTPNSWTTHETLHTVMPTISKNQCIQRHDSVRPAALQYVQGNTGNIVQRTKIGRKKVTKVKVAVLWSQTVRTDRLSLAIDRTGRDGAVRDGEQEHAC